MWEPVLVATGLALFVIGLAPAGWTAVRTPRSLSPAHLVPASAGVLLGLTPIVYLAISGESLGASLPGRPGHVAIVAGSLTLFVTICSLSVMILTGLDSSRKRIGAVMGVLDDVGLPRVVAVAVFVWIVRVIGAMQYGWFYAGSYDPATTPYLFFVVNQIAGFLAFGVVVWSAWVVADDPSKRKKITGTLLLLLEVPFVFTQGRREMLFFVVIVAVVILYAHGRFSPSRAMRVLAVVFALVLVAFPLYQATRSIRGQFAGAGGEGLGPSEYVESVAAASRIEDIDQLYLSNLQHRLSMYYRWQAELASLRESGGSLRGTLLLSGVRYLAPRFARGGEGRVATGEEAIREHYGAPAGDRPNSLAAAGFADFGLIGVGLYGFTFVLALFLIERFAVWVIRHSPLLGAAVAGNLMVLALRTEITMVGIFASLREIALVGCLAVLGAVVVRDYKRVVFGLSVD